MSNIRLLPVSQLDAAIQSDEDWTLSLTFLLADGVSPIILDGISFVASIGGRYNVTGSLYGARSNIVSFFAPASDVLTWLRDQHSFSITATSQSGSGTLTQQVLGDSIFVVGAPRRVDLTPISVSSAFTSSLMLVVPPGYSPQEIIGSLPDVEAGEGIPASGNIYFNDSGYVALSVGPGLTSILAQGSTIGQSVFATLPNVAGGGQIPAPGYFYFNESAFLALSLAADGPTHAVPANPLTAQGALANLPNVLVGDDIPLAGSSFVNDSGYVVKSQ